MIKLYVSLLVLIMGLIVPAPTMAVQYVETFEYETPPSNIFTNGVFDHNIVPISELGFSWVINDWGAPPDGNALHLWPALDQITFNLNPDEYIDYAAIDFVDWNGNTTFEVIGTLDTYSVSITPSSSWEFADTNGQNLGEITMVKLSSYEGAFDNLTINVVPEPTTLLLFGLGGLGLIRKRNV